MPFPYDGTHEQGRGRILIVDDEPFVLRALRRLLMKSYDVVTVSSAEAALDLIASDSAFDAVLCDLNLGPSLSARAFHDRLIAQSSDLASRTIVMSGTPATDSGPFGQRLADRWLLKPFDLAELTALLAMVQPTRPLAVA